MQILRNGHGIPEITASTVADLMRGLGWIHANDRQLQTLLTRILLQGRAAELLKADDALIAIDTYMRRMNFLSDSQAQLAQLEPGTRKAMDAYVKGFNEWMEDNGLVFEFKLLGYRHPEPYAVTDCLRLGKVFGFLGLADIQANMEKFLVEMIQKGLSEEKLKELFPYLTDPIDTALINQVTLSPPLVPAAVEWLNRLPRFNASNNWAVSGRHTRSGFPILCSDPHLEVNRLPNVWQEIVLRLPGNTLIGVSIPGGPGLIIGRSSHLAWSATYAYMDMLDYRIERCRDGNYYRKDGWKPFAVREEEIKVKSKPSIRIKIHENKNGLLEGDPHIEGHYLVLGWSGAKGCGARDFDTLIKMMDTRNVEAAMALFCQVEAVAMNWAFADTQGNIGYQMSGRHFKRPEEISGLLPNAGWDEQFDPQGFNDPEDLPNVFNPPEGFIATANQDLNYLGRSNPINLAMGSYRADRIVQLLETGSDLDVAYMKDMHYDLYSLQAERLMKIIGPVLPDTDNGRLLKAWDLRYHANSTGAMLFESVYRAIIDVVFGDHGIGRDVVDHIFSETSLFNDYYANLDRILEKQSSAWFDGQTRESLFKQGIEAGLRAEPVPYGKTRSITLAHLLFGGQLPKFLGFDYGPLVLPGCRATIPQGQIFKNAGRLTTFSPTYRFITDLAADEIHTNLAGGPSDRRFSKWYVSDLKNWYEGNYKVLR
ncbi:MAG: penicillin acylase family protein [Desulfosarcina sp.]|nr:penicillin acylase family protein [Desulfosarcina sp.]MBC2765324.1 penicillin acylase family protein [Desulfosarcina sp.]